MNHLSEDRISALLIGEGSPQESRHTEDCPSCGGELEQITAALVAFRGAMHAMAGFEFEPRTIRFLIPSRPARRRQAAAGLSSLLFHSAAIAGILVIGSLRPVQTLVKSTMVSLIAPDLRPYIPAKQAAHGGGGGGTRSPIEAEKGKLPKSAPRPFVPPQADSPEHPKLPVTPTIIAEAPNINAPNWGDPLSHLGVPSNGPGCCAGFGGGDGVGIGTDNGPGAGPGKGGGFGGAAFQIGAGVTAPVVLIQVEPEYSDDARKAKWQGTVKLNVVVDEHGMPQQMRVVRSLGLGLDQKAMEAVAKWRFKPGTKSGKPVPVIAVIEVTFRLL